MRTVLFTLATSLALAVAVNATSADKKIELNILYAGHPDSEREADFVTFLSENFTKVTKADLAGLRDGALNGYDVAILDYDGDGFEAPRPGISKDHDGPLLTIGVIGAFIGGGLGLKTGYL